QHHGRVEDAAFEEAVEGAGFGEVGATADTFVVVIELACASDPGGGAADRQALGGRFGAGGGLTDRVGRRLAHRSRLSCQEGVGSAGPVGVPSLAGPSRAPQSCKKGTEKGVHRYAFLGPFSVSSVTWQPPNPDLAGPRSPRGWPLPGNA